MGSYYSWTYDLKNRIKFDIYFCPIPIIFSFGVVVHPCMEETTSKIYLPFYMDFDEEIMRYHLSIKFYFKILFDEYNIIFDSRVQPLIQPRSSPTKNKGLFSRNSLVNKLVEKLALDHQ